MWSMLSRLALLCAGVSVYGQDLTPRPDSSLQALKQILSKQNPVNYVQFSTKPENAGQATQVTATITGVSLDADTCTLSYKDGRVFSKEQYESTQTWQVKIPDIGRVRVESLVGYVERLRSEGGQPGWETKTEPNVFVLLIEGLPNRKFAVHRWSKNKSNEVNERDLQQASAFIVFAEEAGAREAEKSLENVKAFCEAKQPR